MLNTIKESKQTNEPTVYHNKWRPCSPADSISPLTLTLDEFPFALVKTTLLQSLSVCQDVQETQ